MSSNRVLRAAHCRHKMAADLQGEQQAQTGEWGTPATETGLLVLRPRPPRDPMSCRGTKCPKFKSLSSKTHVANKRPLAKHRIVTLTSHWVVMSAVVTFDPRAPKTNQLTWLIHNYWFRQTERMLFSKIYFLEANQWIYVLYTVYEEHISTVS